MSCDSHKCWEACWRAEPWAGRGGGAGPAEAERTLRGAACEAWDLVCVGSGRERGEPGWMALQVGPTAIGPWVAGRGAGLDAICSKVALCVLGFSVGITKAVSLVGVY